MKKDVNNNFDDGFVDIDSGVQAFENAVENMKLSKKILEGELDNSVYRG